MSIAKKTSLLRPNAPHLAPNIKGKALVDFKGIPLEQVNKLIEALMGELPRCPRCGW